MKASFFSVIKEKKFIFCCFIMATVYLLDSLVFFSQFYMMYEYFDLGTISSIATGWSYLAQAAGMILFIMLYKYFHKISGKKSFQVLLFVAEIPIICISLFVPSGTSLIFMIFLLNIIIGLHTGFTFTLVAVQIAPAHHGFCFALAYALGAIGSWLISLPGTEIMTAYFMIFVYSILIALISVLILMYENAFRSEEDGRTEDSMTISVGSEDHSKLMPFSAVTPEQGRELLILGTVIAAMAIITAIGTNDQICVEYAQKINIPAQRAFYALGLIAAGILYDKNHTLCGICTVASLIYPIVLIMLYNETGSFVAVIAISYIFQGFYSVYRAGSFMSVSDRYKLPYLAVMGLVISRIFEALSVFVLNEIGYNKLSTVVISGILFIPLVILFYSMVVEDYDKKQAASTAAATAAIVSARQEAVKEVYAELSAPENAPMLKELTAKERRAAFAEKYGLTRREEEIAEYLANGKTNGEIADSLKLSENTVRFHVSNLLKKTGMKDRNEVSRAYRM